MKVPLTETEMKRIEKALLSYDDKDAISAIEKIRVTLALYYAVERLVKKVLESGTEIDDIDNLEV